LSLGTQFSFGECISCCFKWRLNSTDHEYYTHECKLKAKSLIQIYSNS
jgi:hypothetical protein